VPAWLKKQAYAEYGITQYKSGDYEVHHSIPLSLGGSNSIRNLWPQSTKTFVIERRCRYLSFFECQPIKCALSHSSAPGLLYPIELLDKVLGYFPDVVDCPGALGHQLEMLCDPERFFSVGFFGSLLPLSTIGIPESCVPIF
jgi:hypothetical protein